MAQGLVGRLTVMFGANFKGFDRALAKAQRKINKFGSRLQSFGSEMTRNITVPVLGLGAAAVKLASDFEETSSKFNTVFSSMQIEANKTAATFQKSFGLSERASKQLLGDTGDLLVGFGFTEKAALDLSKKVNELAVDLASFTNFSGGAEGSSLALTKALLGERESIKSLGIAITEADLKRFAAEQSLVFKELDRVAKAQLTYELALKQSQKAVGDYARTSESFANTFRRLKAQLEEVGVEIGQMLMPIFAKFLGLVRDALQVFTNLDPKIKSFLGTVTLLAAAIGPMSFTLGSLVKFAGLFANKIGLSVLALASLVAAFKFVTDNYEAFKERLSDWSWWKNSLIDAVKSLVRVLGPKLSLLIGFKLDELKDETKDFEHEFGSFVDSMKDMGKDLASTMGLLNNPFGLGGGGNPKLDNVDMHPFVSSSTQPQAMGPFNQMQEDIKKTNKELLGLKDNYGLLGDVISNSMTEALESSSNFFDSFIDGITRAIKKLLIQLGVMLAIDVLLGGKNLSKALVLTRMGDLGIPGLAEGGLVSGPTLAMVGEGGSTVSNPEVVAPLDKLRSMMGGNVQQIEVQGRLSGRDIFLSNSKTSNSRFRST